MLRYGVFVVIAGGLVLAFTFGSRQSFGMYLEPISTSMGWSVAVVSLALAIQSIFWGLGQPFFGWIADRFGTGRTLVLGSAIYVAGLFYASRMQTPEDAYLSLGLLVGLGAAGCGMPIVMTAVVRAFPKERHPLVMALTATGVSLGQFFVTPSARPIIDAFGWRNGLLCLMGLIGIVVLLAVVLRSRPVSRSRALEAEQSLREALIEARGHSGYLLLTAGFFVCGFHVQFIVTHLPNFISQSGLPADVGGWAIATVGICNLMGTIAVGFLGSRYRKKYLLSGVYAVRALMFAVYAFTPVTTTTTLIFAAGLGLAWLSTVPLTSAIIGQIFGTRYFGTLFGIVFLGHQAGAFLGASLGGYLFDVTGSYQTIWFINIGLGVFAAIIHLPIADKPIERPLAQPA